MADNNRDPPAQDEEGAAGREASEQAQQAGAGGPQHLPRPQRPGAAGDPPADRDEAGQVSRSVWTHISLPSANPPHISPPTLLCMYVCFITQHVVYTLAACPLSPPLSISPCTYHKGFHCRYFGLLEYS